MMDFEQAVENFYRSVLKKGDVAVDCGAHTGRHTIFMAECVGETGHVFAFEPLPAIFALLKKKLAERNFGNVTAHNVALGTRNSVSDFVYVPDFPGYSGFRERVYDHDNVVREIIKVNVRSLDNSLSVDRLRYVKIDAEGGDLRILQGARETIRKFRPSMTFELGDNSIRDYEYTAADYYDFFDSLDYDLFTITGDKLDRDALISSSQRQAVWDYIAAPIESDTRSEALKRICMAGE